MRILMVSTAYLPKTDGIVVSVVNSTKRLAKKGHKICIICSEYEDYKDEQQENIEIHRIKSFGIPSYPGIRFGQPRVKEIMDIVKEFQPDIIHTHDPATLGLIGWVAAKTYKIPIISTYHTSIPDMVVYITPKKLLKLDEFINKIKDKSKIPERIEELHLRFKNRLGIKEKEEREFISRETVWKITNIYYNRVDLVIAPSNRIKKEAKKYKVKVKTIVISNGLELDLFKAKIKYNDFPKFLHVGRLGFEKKIDVIIKAMAHVVQKYPDAKLDIVGDGPAKDELEDLTKKLNISESVNFLGYIKRNELPEIYRQHDVFLTASEMETQGIVLVEAIASGLPIIGVNVLAVPDIVHNNKTGFLVPKGKSEKMAEKMIQFIENPKLIKEYGINARKEAEKHDINNVVNKLEKTYEKFI